MNISFAKRARAIYWTKVWAGILVSVLTVANCTEARSPEAVIGKNNRVKLEVAQSEQEIERGLMYRTSMPEDDGMVFLFDPPRPVNFWMYHTLIPLDMLFVKDNKVIKLFENVPPCKSQNPHECPTYPTGEGIMVNEVIELNGGYSQRHGIKEGDPVNYTIHVSKTGGASSSK